MTKYTGVEKYIFADVYNFFLKFKDIPDEEYYWDVCIADARILCFKYKDHPLCTSMVADVISQLEHIICNKPLSGFSREQWEERLQIAKK